jgi:hypothetical protein
VRVVDLAAERCAPVDQTAIAEGKIITPRPGFDAKGPDGKPAMRTPTVMGWIDRPETSEAAKGRAIDRLALDHERCRLGAKDTGSKSSPKEAKACVAQ